MVQARGVDALQVSRAPSSFSLGFRLLQLLRVKTREQLELDQTLF